MRLEQHIRKMARSSYWQQIFRSSKECAGIHLFENKSNFSGLQYLFMHWLYIYCMLYEELNRLEWDNLDIKVIEDNDRCDAFLYYRSKKIEKDIRKAKKEERKAKRKEKRNIMKIFSGAKNKEGDK